MKIALVAHTETFKICQKTIPKMLKFLDSFEKQTGIRSKVNWMLEQDDMRPFNCEIRSSNDGRVIEQGSDFFKDIINYRKDEVGLHVHFTKGWRFDPSFENQERQIKSAYEKFTDSFGFEPKSFVGGWWYSDFNTIKILEKMKFKVDASPMPLYKETRRKWLWGKVLAPFRVSTCNWSGCEKRRPWHPDYKNICKDGRAKILYIPNAVDPKATNNPISYLISLDMLDTNLNSALTAFKNFAKSKIPIIAIPFHPQSLTMEKINSIEKFLSNITETTKISFARLDEI